METEVCMFMHIYTYDVRISQAEDRKETEHVHCMCVLFKGYLFNAPTKVLLLHLKGMNIMYFISH